jgi:peptidoglycan/LPS O-acetylase OafA/YrhL
MLNLNPIAPGSNRLGTFRLSLNEKVDICRGLFAFLVVGAHAVDISWSIHPEARNQYPWWLHNFLLYVVGAGVYWVIGFFVISGFCIQLSVSRMIEGNSLPLSRYLIARVSRILPLYYLALVFAVVIEWLMAASRPPCWSNGLNGNALLAQLFIAQNFTQTFGSYAPSWSITNEMFYYLFYGFVVCAALKCRIRPTTLGMIICLGIAFPMNLLYFGWSRSPFLLGLGLLFGMGAFWFLGAMIADHRETLRQSRLARAGSAYWPLLLATAIASWFSQRIHLQFVYVLLAISFTLMLIRFIVVEDTTVGARERTHSSRVIETLGLASYPTYLFHGPLLMLLASAILRANLVVDWRVIWAILVLVGISSGIALAHLAERPIMNWRSALLKRLRSSRESLAGSSVKVRIAGVQQ